MAVKTLVFEGRVTALTSISHIGRTYGTHSKLRREKIVQPDGTVEEVPIISGNSMRGILRDRGMLHMLKALGYGVNEETGEVRGLSLAAFYFLLSGGSLTSDASRGLNIKEARRWRDLIPLVSLFGGAMGNQIMPGKVKIGKMIPICAETVHLLPERFSEPEPESIWGMLQEESYTRSDDEKNEKLRQLIKPDVRKLLEDKAADEQEKRGTRQDIRGSGQKQQMRYHVETIAAGTEMFWDITLDDVSDLEFEAFCAALASFARFPYVGGKSGVGHGKVSVEFDDWTEINPRLAPQGKEISFKLGTLYQAHLEEHAEEIRELLNELS